VFLFRGLSTRTITTLLLLPGTFTSALAATPPGEGVPVRVDLVREQAIQRLVQLTGTVTSEQSARLSASTGGLVTVLHVDAGSIVAAGDVLLELDSELAQWQWKSSQASADAARIALADARRRLDEARSLAPQRSIAETVVHDIAAEAAEDEAALQRAEAEAGYRKGILERHLLHAPFAGVVSAKHTELGEWVNPGEPVLELVATQELRIDFSVAEDYLAAIGPDTAVSYTLGANAGEAREGEVATVVPVTDPGARTFLLRVRALQRDPRMTPGMSARAVLKLDAGRRGLTIPRDATLKFPDGRVVVWVAESGDDGPVATEKRVDIGLVFDGRVEVIEGLEAGDRVVVQGNEALQNGQRVVVLPGPPG
jgi:membrane fusion protein (multidrug efflux system)